MANVMVTNEKLFFELLNQKQKEKVLQLIVDECTRQTFNPTPQKDFLEIHEIYKTIKGEYRKTFTT